MTNASYENAMTRLHAGDMIVLDGGVSTELERRGVPMVDGLWSGRVALDDWQALVDVHLAYLDAGADVITANTYASSRLVLGPAGLGDRVKEINRRAVEAALAARERHGRDEVLVAGALSHMIPPPKGAYLPQRKPVVDPGTLHDASAEMAEILKAAGSDLILLEMMSDPARMAPIFDAIAEAHLPVWCGLSAVRGKDGTPVSFHDRDVSFATILALAARRGFDVLGIMHTGADLIGDLLAVIRAAHDGPIMAYPDAGHFEMPHWQFSDEIAPERFRDFARDWREAGAAIIGGCCGLGPEHIRTIAPLGTAQA